MVTRNQHDGTNSSGWWDDLPPAVKKRVQRPITEATTTRASELDVPVPYRPAVAYDLTRLAVLFLGVALANLLFLLVALSFLTNH